MAAITTVSSFNGAGDGTITGFTNVLGTGPNMVEANGAAWPKDRLADAAMVTTTTYTELYDLNNSKGYVARIPMVGGDSRGEYTPNSKLGILYNYTDDANYNEAVLEIAAIKIGDGSYHDEVKLYETVAGVTEEVGDTTPLKSHQTSPGDLRNYYAKTGSTISITKVDDQHFLKMSLFDRHGRHDQADLLIRHETHDTGSPAAKKVGVKFYAGRHTFGIGSFQAQLIDVKFQSNAGNDSNNGTLGSPYASYGKLLENVTANMVGIIEAGTTASSISTLTHSFNAGTSHEDGPFLSGRAGETPVQQASDSLATIYLRGQGGETQLKYITFNGWKLDSLTTANSGIRMFVNTITPGSNLQQQFLRYSNLIVERAAVVNIIIDAVSPIIAPGASGDTDFQAGHHFTDIETRNAGSSHGFYHSNGRNLCIEYIYSHDNGGDGGKSAFGSAGYGNLDMNENTTCRYIRVHDCGRLGWYMRGGPNLELAYNRVWDSALTSSGDFGLGTFNEVKSCYIHHNVVFRCGQTVAGGITVSNRFNQVVTGPVVIAYNTVFDCPAYGINVTTVGSGVTENVSIHSNVVHDSGTADIDIDAGSTGPTVTATNNHVTSDGDPLFVNEGAGVEDFNLQAGSPLIGVGTVNTDPLYAFAIDGKLFAQGAKMAIGAYNVEYVGKQYFVNQSVGNAGNSGLGRGAGLAWADLHDALAKVAPGDTINLEAGNIGVKVTTNGAGQTNAPGGTSWDAPVTIQPDGTAVVTMTANNGGNLYQLNLDGAGGGTGPTTYLIFQKGSGTFISDGVSTGFGATWGMLRLTEGSHHILLDGLTIRNHARAGIFGEAASGVEESQHLEIKNCDIRGNGTSGTFPNIILASSDNWVHHTETQNASGWGLSIGDFTSVAPNRNIAEILDCHDNGAGSGGLRITTGIQNLIRTNLVYDENKGIQTGLGAPRRSNWLIQNSIYNIFERALETALSSQNAQILNNIVYIAGTPINDAGTTTVQQNNLLNTSDPKFTNLTPGFYDFSLQVDSPARDAGTAIASIVADYIGTSRPQGVGLDQGAYEYFVPVVGDLEVVMPPTHAGIVNVAVPISVQVSDVANRGRAAWLRITAGDLNVTPVGTTIKTGGA